jgi:hypothetical protein
VSDFDVHADGMDIERPLQFSDREVESLLRRRIPAERQEVDALVAVIGTLRSTRRGPRPRAGADLTAVFAHGLPEHCSPAPSWAIPPDPALPPVRTASRRARRKPRRALTGLSAVLGTLGGKLMIAGAIAAASVGGAQVTGVIDVPGLPDRARITDEAGERDRGPAPEVSEVGEQDHATAANADEASEQDRAPEPRADQARTQGARADETKSEQRDGGVDGGEVSDRANGGASQQDAAAFGQSVADDAAEGIPPTAPLEGLDPEGASLPARATAVRTYPLGRQETRMRTIRRMGARTTSSPAAGPRRRP